MYSIDLQNPVTAMAHNGDVMVSGRQNGGILWFDYQQKIFFAETFHHNAITDICFVNDIETRVLTSSADMTLKLWAIEGDHIRTFKGHENFVLGCASQDHLIASGGNDKNLILWDSRSKTFEHKIKTNSQILALEFDKFIYAGDASGKITIYDVRQLKSIDSVGHNNAILGLHFNNNHLVSSSLDNTIKLWNVENSGSCKLLTVFDNPMNNLTLNSIRPYLSDGGHYVACGTAVGNVNIFEIVSQELIYTLGGHVDSVTQVLISDSNLISCSLDGKILVGELNIMD
eukprot:NODE_84_length_22354_cov_0.646506.p11 type:complete len:286 gc:universal NODE_84_length_22354_cov_0.646506:18055-17198(-)